MNHDTFPKIGYPRHSGAGFGRFLLFINLVLFLFLAIFGTIMGMSRFAKYGLDGLDPRFRIVKVENNPDTVEKP